MGIASGQNRAERKKVNNYPLRSRHGRARGRGCARKSSGGVKRRPSSARQTAAKIKRSGGGTKRWKEGKKRELVRIFPRVLTGPATNRATNNAVLCGSAALTRRPNTPAGPRQLFQQTTKQWTVAKRY